MFDIGWSEFVVIGVVALIVIGPKELPAVLRAIGQWTTKIRRMAGEFQSQFQEAMREAEMADLKKSVDELSDATKGITADPFDFSESTKWQPKTDGAASESAPTPAEGTLPADAAPAATTESAATTAVTATEVPAAADTPASASAAPGSGASPSPPAAEPIAEGSGRA
jgi:sec-independent protein translocase protein TatB